MQNFQNDPDFDWITGMIIAVFGAILAIIVIWMICHLERGKIFPQTDTRSAMFAEKNLKSNL